jgi:hypothetical protein
MDTRVFCVWTGTNPLSSARQQSIDTFAERSGCPLILVTEETLKDWIVTPLHPAYPYLSFVHRSDYLRCYFMYHYGGGYTDIKPTTGSWKDAFATLEQTPDLWAIGYGEDSPDCIACVDDADLYGRMRGVYTRMLGNCSYICKRGTPFVNDWFHAVHSVLDAKYEALKANPAQSPRDCTQSNPNYCLRWTEICGNIFHPVCFRYLEHTTTGLPKPICEHYQ